MQRRHYLALADVSITVLAGCSGEEGGGDNSSDGTETADTEELAETAEPTTATTTEPPADETAMVETEAETDTETMIQTETPTSTETATETETEAKTMMETETPTATSTATPAAQEGFSETYSGNGQSTVEGLELTPGPITVEVTVGSEAYHTFELITLEGESYEDVRLVDGLFSALLNRHKAVEFTVSQLV